MNIFYLNEKADIAAKQHVDKHVVKMIIEYAQLMSTAHRMLDGKQWYDKTANGRRIARWEHPEREKDAVLYKASHINHPSAIWARDSCANYEWLYSLWMNLCEEYTHRYGKVHLTQQKLQSILGNPRSTLSKIRCPKFLKLCQKMLNNKTLSKHTKNIIVIISLTWLSGQKEKLQSGITQHR